MSTISKEENILKRRLLYDGHGSGEDKRLVNLMKNISKFCLTEMPMDEMVKLCSIVSKDLSTAIYVAERSEKISDMSDRTLENLDKVIEEEGQRLARMKNELNNLAMDLEFFKKLKEINQLPNLETTEQTMKVIETRKQELMTKLADQQTKLNYLMDGCLKLEFVMRDDEE